MVNEMLTEQQINALIDWNFSDRELFLGDGVGAQTLSACELDTFLVGDVLAVAEEKCKSNHKEFAYPILISNYGTENVGGVFHFSEKVEDVFHFAEGIQAGRCSRIERDELLEVCWVLFCVDGQYKMFVEHLYEKDGGVMVDVTEKFVGQILGWGEG